MSEGGRWDTHNSFRSELRRKSVEGLVNYLDVVGRYSRVRICESFPEFLDDDLKRVFLFNLQDWLHEYSF